MLLDHVVLFVDDLDDAVNIFSSHGFTVTPGGINGPTHNALIAFENETYIELIALQNEQHDGSLSLCVAQVCCAFAV